MDNYHEIAINAYVIVDLGSIIDITHIYGSILFPTESSFEVQWHPCYNLFSYLLFDWLYRYKAPVYRQCTEAFVVNKWRLLVYS